MKEQNHSINNEYSIKKVIDLNEFEKLRTVWDGLANKQDAYVPFLCFDWFKIWLEHFLKDDKLLILLLYKGSELVTIAPFLIKEEKFKGINVRKIELAGNVYSPIRYFLFKEMGNGERESTLSYIFVFFSKFHRQWDIIDLSPIPEENGNFIALKNAVLKSSFKNAEIFCFGNWYLDGISYQSDKYFSNLSKKERKNIRQDRNRMEKAGKVVFKMIKNSHEVETYMKTYFEIYEKSWKKREMAGPGFYLDLTRCFGEKDWLRLGFVFLSDVPTAVGFAFVCDGLAYFEKVAYDEDYQNLGAGSVWFMEMIKYVIDVDKVRGIDFLRGDDPYKKHWVPQRRERKGILVFNNNLKGNYLSILVQYILPTFNRNKHLRKIKELVSNKVFKIMAA
jgi:CelD/BcsL family acetyltransferase involved in cellulose biosynthesis